MVGRTVATVKRLGRSGAAGQTLVVATLMAAHTAHGQESSRLLATSGVVNVEGVGGGGLVPWALITGYGSRDQVGADVHATGVALSDFALGSAGIAAGFYDRVELSYAHEWFDTGNAGARLGLGRGYRFEEDVAGLKIRLVGDAVWDQDSWLPQVAAGTELRSADQHAVQARQPRLRPRGRRVGHLRRLLPQQAPVGDARLR